MCPTSPEPRRYPAPIGDIIAAQDAGIAAFSRGDTIADCPYRPTTPANQYLMKMWVRGFSTAHAEADPAASHD